MAQQQSRLNRGPPVLTSPPDPLPQIALKQIPGVISSDLNSPTIVWVRVPPPLLSAHTSRAVARTRTLNNFFFMIVEPGVE